MKPRPPVCTWIACPVCTTLEVVQHPGNKTAACPLCSWAGPCLNLMIIGSRGKDNPNPIFYPMGPDEMDMTKEERKALAARLLSAIRARQNAHPKSSYYTEAEDETEQTRAAR